MPILRDDAFPFYFVVFSHDFRSIYASSFRRIKITDLPGIKFRQDGHDRIDNFGIVRRWCCRSWYEQLFTVDVPIDGHHSRILLRYSVQPNARVLPVDRKCQYRADSHPGS